MQVWPAIDLRGGKCVRLQQGDYGRETVFGDDPVAVARQFQADGAKHLHLVDLDGARDGKLVNRDVIAAIVRAVTLEVEIGGGIREEATIRELFDLGLGRLVIGTKAQRDPQWFREMCRLFPGRLAVGIDAREGKVATHGWLETSQVAALDLARSYQDLKVASLIYTDIARDGMLAGPNLPAMREMQSAVNLPVIASGGVSNAADVAALAAIPMAGAIIGRALYEGKVTLPEALRAATA